MLKCLTAYKTILCKLAAPLKKSDYYSRFFTFKMNDLVMQSSYKNKLFYAFLKLFYIARPLHSSIYLLNFKYLNQDYLLISI